MSCVSTDALLQAGTGCTLTKTILRNEDGGAYADQSTSRRHLGVSCLFIDDDDDQTRVHGATLL